MVILSLSKFQVSMSCTKVCLKFKKKILKGGEELQKLKKKKMRQVRVCYPGCCELTVTQAGLKLALLLFHPSMLLGTQAVPLAQQACSFITTSCEN